MYIDMFNGWYFFWLAIAAGLTVGLYFLLKNKSSRTQNIVLFSLLAVGLILHFLKVYIPPYSVDEARMLRDAWFVNICSANIALFPFFYLTKSNKLKDYMFYVGVLSGLIALFYPQEPMAKVDQMGETLDILRFYYHHWMVMAVPLLMVLLKKHKLSYRRILWAPTILLIVMLFIMLNQLFQSELGFIPLGNRTDFFDIAYKNTSYIWGPGVNDAIGNFLAIFTPEFFTIVPAGPYEGQVKYWPWFWIIVPVYILVTALSFGLAMIFDHKAFVADLKLLKIKICAFINAHKKVKNSTAPEIDAEADAPDAIAEDAEPDVISAEENYSEVDSEKDATV